VGSNPTSSATVLCQDIGDAVSEHGRHSVSDWPLVALFRVDIEVKFTISTPTSPSKTRWVMSPCQRALGSNASKRW
jgi:hypothetical protein